MLFQLVLGYARVAEVTQSGGVVLCKVSLHALGGDWLITYLTQCDVSPAVQLMEGEGAAGYLVLAEGGRVRTDLTSYPPNYYSPGCEGGATGEQLKLSR